jgi:tetratricopeptide (TPR) repeat protein
MMERKVKQPGMRPEKVLKRRAARMCRQAGRLADAAAIYGELLKQHPEDPQLWLEGGELAKERGETEVAINRLERAMELSAGPLGEAMAAAAVTRMHRGEWVKAGRLWWQVARSEGHAVRGWAGLLLCAHCAGKARLACRVQRRLEMHSSKRERRLLMAQLWHEAGAAVAWQEAGNVAEHEPAQAQGVYQCLLRRAARTLGRTAGQFAGRADVHYHRAVCEKALGHEQAALASTGQAVAINPNYVAAGKLRSELTSQVKVAA